MHVFKTWSVSVREGTVRGLFAAKTLLSKMGPADHLLFFDGQLVILALFWPLFARHIRVKRVSIIYLQGPERISSRWLTRWVIASFLERRETRLFLRTEELEAAWRRAFERVPAAQIRYLPSLEVFDDAANGSPNDWQGPTRFGVLGQIREGKSLDWLVPAFREDPGLGLLTIAGPFADRRAREKFKALNEFDGLDARYLSERGLLDVARAQDYLLVLYQPWDDRMESAALYLAARAHRPVVTFARGWCGRMITQYGCGVAVSGSHREVLEALRQLPKPGTHQYHKLLDGVSAFRDAHLASALLPKFREIIEV